MNKEIASKANAGFLRRLAAFCIDVVIISVPIFLLIGITSLTAEIFYIINIIGFLYEFILVAMFGATVGKWILGLVVVDYKYKYPIGFVHSFFRQLWKSVIPLPLSSLVIIFDQKKRAAHDKVADTYVAHKEKIRQVPIRKEKRKEKEVFVPSKGSAPPLKIVYGEAEDE